MGTQEPTIIWGKWRYLKTGQPYRTGKDENGQPYEEYGEIFSDLGTPRESVLPDISGLSNEFEDLSTAQETSFDPTENYRHQKQYQTPEGSEQVSTSSHRRTRKGYVDDQHSKSSQVDQKSKGRGKYTSRNHDENRGHKSSRGHGKGKGKERAQSPDSRESADTDGEYDGETQGQNPEGMDAEVVQLSDISVQTASMPPVATQPYPSLGMITSYPVGEGNEFDVGLSNQLKNMYQNGQFGGESSAQGSGAYMLGAEDEDTVSALPRSAEDWSMYVREPSWKFQFGAVFKVKWSEPMGESKLSTRNRDPVGSGISISTHRQTQYGDTFLYEGIRRFIVVDGPGSGNGNSVCVPIATYGNKACTKPGIKAKVHGIIHTQGQTSKPLRGEPELGVDPIRLQINSDLKWSEKLKRESRVNYSKHVTIEHNSSVFFIGNIHGEDRDILADAVDKLWEHRVKSRAKHGKSRK